ncbi:MAG: helix-turn-helix transcriptional regulator [Eubacteriales bacterium]|nr:helix-turn-helix transcriptional regulator [Eubacteriales bacterium]
MYEIYCRLRDERGLRDADVAKGAGITKSTFTEWKSGRSKPGTDKLIKLADFFGVSVDYLMGVSKTIVPVDAIGGLPPEYINVVAKARDEGFFPEDIELALNMLRMVRKK